MAANRCDSADQLMINSFILAVISPLLPDAEATDPNPPGLLFFGGPLLVGAVTAVARGILI